MNHDSTAWGETHLNDLIDVVCDQFESELKRDTQPRIEEVLKSVPGSIRQNLLRELLTVEVEFLRQRGRQVVFSEYYVRFPSERTVVDQIRLQYEPSSFHSAVTPACTVYGNRTEAVVPAGPPQQIKHFQLRSVVGKGGFGVVWRAFDTKLQREVAVKIPRTDVADLFGVLKEARASAMLHHPNIVTVFEVGEGEQRSSAYIVTEYINGPNLKQWSENRQCTPRQVAELVQQIAEALEHAHSRGIIHRDLKPANVLLDSLDRPHLADFGLATWSNTDGTESITNDVAGTPAYMSPEQTRANAAIDLRSDIYSLGVILYELITGERPFRGTQEQLFDHIVNSQPKPPHELNRLVPEELEKICLKCLNKKPADRYQSAKHLADDLERFLQRQSPLGVVVSPRRRLINWVSRNRMIGLGLVAAFCAGLAILALGSWLSDRGSRCQVPSNNRYSLILIPPVARSRSFRSIPKREISM